MSQSSLDSTKQYIAMKDLRTLNKWFELLLRKGLRVEELQSSIGNPIQLQRIIQFIRNGAPNYTISPLYYDFETVSAMLMKGGNLDAPLSDSLLPGRVPDPLSGHITFFDPGFNMFCFYGHNAKLFDSDSMALHENDAFMMLEEEPRFRQIRLETVREELMVSDSQMDRPEYSLSLARRVFMASFIHFQATGERLFLKQRARTLDVDNDGDPILIGNDEGDACNFVLLGESFPHRYGFVVERNWES